MDAVRCALILVLLMALGLGAKAAPVDLSTEQVHDWLLNVIPLPKEATVKQKLTVPLNSLGMVVQEKAGAPWAKEAARIAQEIQEETGGSLAAPFMAGFTLVIGQIDEDGKVEGRQVKSAERLAGLKNADQAYVIEAAGEEAIIIAGNGPAGVYYGLKTLWQLVKPTVRAQYRRVVADFPIGTIVDWPDLAERGEWGGSANRDIEWMSERKMNLVESHCSSLSIAADGKGVANFDKTLIERGAECAVKVVPIITHLDQLQGAGLFEAFPETLGVGDPKTWPYGGTTVKPACFSKEQTAKALADWMVSLAEQPEITDISVWLSEHHVTCKCDDCKQLGQFKLEAQAVARGYELAKQARPDIRLRVLLTQGSYEFNDQVIATLPRDIGITYYDGGRTYDSSRDEMIYPLLEQYAKDGGWLGCYPQLTATWRLVCPWSGPQFIRYRMNEFVDDGLASLCGYATPDNRFYDFNVNAAAEWSWNAKGRDEREFALAYFTKKQVADPQKAADWAVMLGPVAWDVYGARVPFSWFFGRAAQVVQAGTVPPLGEGLFAYIPDEDHLARNLAVCAAAMKLAQDVGDPAMVTETAVVEGYLKMLRCIHQIGDAVGKKKELSAEEKAAVSILMGEMDAATIQTTESLNAWQEAVAPDNRAGRFEDTLRVTEDTCVGIGEALGALGVEDPGRPYRMQQVGLWQTEDFAAGPETTKKWDVTDKLAGPGKYYAKFVYESGWYGLAIHRASIASASADAPDTLSTVASDDHQGTAAYENKANIYEFELEAVEPGQKYHLVADVRGMPEQSPPDKQGCNGKIVFWKARPE